MLTSRPSTGPTVVRIRPVEVPDSYGESVRRDYGPGADRLTLSRAHVTTARVTYAPTEGAPERIERETRLTVDGAADIASGDRVAIDGALWRIEGEPTLRRGLTLRPTTVATLTRVTN